MNPRPLPYQGSALPPELYQRINLIGLKAPINVANTMPKPIPMQEPIMHAFLKSLLLYVPEKRKAAIKRLETKKSLSQSAKKTINAF